MLAVIAGSGALPARVVASAQGSVVTCEMAGSPADLPAGPDIRFRLETLGSLLATLKARGVTEICLAGGVRRPVIDPSAIDGATLPFVERIAGALRAGDDGALRTVLAILEEAGFAIRAAQDIVPDLVPAAGVLSRIHPSPADGADAGRAAGIVAALGRADVGQGCVVAAGQALALEALPGTDHMLACLTPRPAGLPAGGLLYKAPKPTQDRRVDLPAIGPGTVKQAAAAGLTGIVIEAGGVMILDREATVAEADDAGLFLWAREAQPADRDAATGERV